MHCSNHTEHHKNGCIVSHNINHNYTSTKCTFNCNMSITGPKNGTAASPQARTTAKVVREIHSYYL